MRTEMQNDNPVGYAAGKNTSQPDGSCNSAADDTPPLPKHIPFPEYPITSELINELVMFLFCTFAAAMQFINIYRTLWWLPESNMKHTVNVYLIEPYLLAFIVLLMSRRFLYCLLIRSQDVLKQLSCKQRRIYTFVIKYSFSILLLLLLGFCVYKIYDKSSFIPVFLLVYPFIIYLLIFGFQIESFLRTSCEVDGAYFNGMPMHCCSSCPNTVRNEIDVLKNDFNIRFKQIVFTSLLNAYYAGLVPCFFAVSIYYNVLWAYQHALLVWLSCLTMATAFCFPSKYSDILHRASLHLGYWVHVIGECSSSSTGGASGSVGGSSNINSNSSSNASFGPAIMWKPASVWVQGSVVKYNEELFCCEGPVTVAQPGNSSHSRFYKLFRNPATIYMILTGAQAGIVLAGIIVLYYAVEWHFVLSLSFVTLTNQFTFFKIMRDYLVTKRIYTAEAAIAEHTKSNTINSF